MVRSDFAATDGLTPKAVPDAVRSVIQAGGLVGFGTALKPSSINQTDGTGGSAVATGGEGGSVTATGGAATTNPVVFAPGDTANATAISSSSANSKAVAINNIGPGRHPPHPLHP